MPSSKNNSLFHKVRKAINGPQNTKKSRNQPHRSRPCELENEVPTIHDAYSVILCHKYFSKSVQKSLAFLAGL